MASIGQTPDTCGIEADTQYRGQDLFSAAGLSYSMVADTGECCRRAANPSFPSTVTRECASFPSDTTREYPSSLLILQGNTLIDFYC